jgi:hypothetical protein
MFLLQKEFPNFVLQKKYPMLQKEYLSNVAGKNTTPSKRHPP